MVFFYIGCKYELSGGKDEPEQRLISIKDMNIEEAMSIICY